MDSTQTGMCSLEHLGRGGKKRREERRQGGQRRGGENRAGKRGEERGEGRGGEKEEEEKGRRGKKERRGEEREVGRRGEGKRGDGREGEKIEKGRKKEKRNKLKSTSSENQQLRSKNSMYVCQTDKPFNADIRRALLHVLHVLSFPQMIPHDFPNSRFFHLVTHSIFSTVISFAELKIVILSSGKLKYNLQ